MKKVYIIIFTLTFAGLFTAIQAQTYRADQAKTVIWWQGKKIGGEHRGTIKLKSAEVEMKYNKPSGGTVVIDMNSIVNTDIENEGTRKRLEDHLKSEDFFDVEKYPEARFEITGSERNNGGSIKVTGNLTIKGITKPLGFTCDLTASDEILIFNGHIDIDRTLFDVRYRSAKFFENIADRAINDIFTLDYELYLEKIIE